MDNPDTLRKLLQFLRKEALCYGSKYILKSYVKDPRYRINFWLRVGQYVNLNSKGYFSKRILLRVIKNHLQIKYGFDTTFNVKIGIGLRIVHLGSIVVHGNSKIGCNCTLLNNINIGQSSRNAPFSVPEIGDNVYIGAGAKIVGKISLGDNTTVGALTLVNKSFTENSVIVGIPGKLVKEKSF